MHIFRLKDTSLEDSEDLPERDVSAPATISQRAPVQLRPPCRKRPLIVAIAPPARRHEDHTTDHGYAPSLPSIGKKGRSRRATWTRRLEGFLSFCTFIDHTSRPSSSSSTRSSSSSSAVPEKMCSRTCRSEFDEEMSVVPDWKFRWLITASVSTGET